MCTITISVFLCIGFSFFLIGNCDVMYIKKGFVIGILNIFLILSQIWNPEFSVRFSVIFPQTKGIKFL